MTGEKPDHEIEAGGVEQEDPMAWADPTLQRACEASDFVPQLGVGQRPNRRVAVGEGVRDIRGTDFRPML
jgi:hypothetical protein